METIKIYEDKYGDKFIKMKVEFILDIPIDDDVKSINKKQTLDALFEMERTDLGEEILNNSENFHIISVSDNIEHIEEKYEYSQNIQSTVKEKTYLSFDIFIETVKSEMSKGNKFAEIFSSDEFTNDDIEKIKQIGFDLYRENNKYCITWDNLK